MNWNAKRVLTEQQLPHVWVEIERNGQRHVCRGTVTIPRNPLAFPRVSFVVESGAASERVSYEWTAEAIARALNGEHMLIA
jgi:hypothetical protein